MSNLYECIRCKYTTERKDTMRKHLDKVIKCQKTIDAIGYSDKEINELSLIKVCKRNNKDNKCIHCSNTYCNSYTLKRHIDKFCKNKNNGIGGGEGSSVDAGSEGTVINNINNGQILNQTNNVNINIINLPVSFDKDWNTEHMNKYLKELIVVSDNKYTSLLGKILDNKKNLNVIFDKEMDNGYIFSENQYKNVEKQEIVDKSMEKLNKELNKMLEEVVESKDILCEKNMEVHKNLINDKYSEYVTNMNIQKIVQKYIIDIYDTTKNVASEYLLEYRKVNKEGF